MRTFTAHEMKESWTEGFRAGIIEGRIRQQRESNAAKHLSYKSGYAAALRDALVAVYEIQDDGDSSTEWDRDYDVDPTGETRSPRIWVREAMAAIEAANIYRNDGKGERHE